MNSQPIPLKMRAAMALDPSMQVCMRKVLLNDHECKPDPLQPKKMYEWEHTLTFAGKRLNEPWAIISICWLTHRGGLLDKQKNIWIALNRATDQELLSISKAVDYFRMRRNLNSIYGDKKLIINKPEEKIAYGN